MIEELNIGSEANDGTGDLLRDAFEKVNNNFNKVPEKEEYSHATNQLSELNAKGKVLLHSNIPSRWPDSNSVGPVISFIYDGHQPELISANGRPSPFTGYNNLFNTYNINFGFSVLGYTFDGDKYMTLEQIQTLITNGHEAMAHISGANDSSWQGTGLADFTYNQAVENLQARKKGLDDLGISTKNANWLGGQSTVAFRSAARNFWRSARGVGGDGGQNTEPINTYNLNSRDLDWIYRYPELGVNLNTFKADVDTCIENKSWLIFYGHWGIDDWFNKYDENGDVDENGAYYGWQILELLIQYIQAKSGYGTADGVKILTPDQAMDYFENAIDIGDSTNYLRVSKTGKVSLSGMGLGYLADTLNITQGDNGSVEIGYDNNGGLARNVLIGRQASFGNTKEWITAVGYQAAANNTSTHVTGIGYKALNGASADLGVAVGFEAGYNAGSDWLVAVGYQAGYNASGNYQIGVGRQSIYASTGHYNIGIGYRALISNAYNYVIAIGREAGNGNTDHNVFIVKDNSLNTNPLIKGFLSTGGIILGAPTTAVEDAKLGNNRVSFYLDETEGSEKLKFKVKLSTGTVKTGEVALS